MVVRAFFSIESSRRPSATSCIESAGATDGLAILDCESGGPAERDFRASGRLTAAEILAVPIKKVALIQEAR
jgi:hypothetical protein